MSRLSQIQLDFDANPEWGAWLCNMAHDEVNALCDESHAPAVAACVQHPHKSHTVGALVHGPRRRRALRAAQRALVKTTRRRIDWVLASELGLAVLVCALLLWAAVRG